MKLEYLIIIFILLSNIVDGQDSLSFRPKIIFNGGFRILENNSSGSVYDRWNFRSDFSLSLRTPIFKRFEMGIFYDLEKNHSRINDPSSGYMSDDTSIVKDYGIFCRYIFKPYQKIYFYIQPTFSKHIHDRGIGLIKNTNKITVSLGFTYPISKYFGFSLKYGDLIYSLRDKNKYWKAYNFEAEFNLFKVKLGAELRF